MGNLTPEAVSYLQFLNSLKQEQGIEGLLAFATDPLGTGEKGSGIISEAVAAKLREQGEDANINDETIFEWNEEGIGPKGGAQITLIDEFKQSPVEEEEEEEEEKEEEEEEDDSGGGGDEGGGDEGGGDEGGGDEGGGDEGGGDDPFIWEDPFAGIDDGGFFDEKDPTSLNKKGVPTFSDADLLRAQLMLESELRMAGFDTPAIGRLIDNWIIPRLTGTFVHPDTGVTMLAPKNAMDIMPELYEREEFKVRFPGYHKRLEQGYNAIAIGDYLTYETRFKELLTQYGLDSVMGQDKKRVTDYIGDLIAGNVSVQQLDKRINQGIGAVLNAPPEVLQQYEKWYGAVGENALLATFLDPNADLFALGEQVQAATAAGYAKNILGNKGDITQSMAEEIADLDYTNQQLQGAYTALSQQTDLFRSRLGEENISIADEGVSYALNLDPEVTKRMEKRRARRTSAFAGSGGALTQGGSLTGYGASNA